MADGEIRNDDEFRVPVYFSGLEYDGKAPTDIDGMFELNDKVWVIYEVKNKGTMMNTGQRLLMERFVKDMYNAGKTAYAIYCWHEPDVDKIYLADCEVISYRFNDHPKWAVPRQKYTVKEMTDEIIGKTYNEGVA